MSPEDVISPKTAHLGQSQRSHEENQERAYIAASRRSDRSIDARLQSAKSASKVHKKRTGKGYHITRDIVMKQEMYEEEDSGLRRPYRLFLSTSVPADAAKLILRMDTDHLKRLSLSSLAAEFNAELRQNDVNTAFVQSFRNFGRGPRPAVPIWPENAYQPQPQETQATSHLRSVPDIPKSTSLDWAQSVRVGSPTNAELPAAPIAAWHRPSSGADMPTTGRKSSIGSATAPDFLLEADDYSAPAFFSDLTPKAKMPRGVVNTNGKVEAFTAAPLFESNNATRLNEIGGINAPTAIGSYESDKAMIELWNTFIDDAALDDDKQ